MVRRYTGKKSVSVEINGREFVVEAEFKGYSDPGRCYPCSNEDAYPPEGGEEETGRTYMVDTEVVDEDTWLRRILDEVNNAVDNQDMVEDD